MWHTMAGHLPPEPPTEAMLRGNDFEAGVLKRFYRQHPELTRNAVQEQRSRTVGDWLVITPDSEAFDHGTDADIAGRIWTVGVEVKTTDDWTEWGQPGTDEVPDHYRAQILVQAEVLGWDVVYVPVMGPWWDYREYIVSPDHDLAEAILAKCRSFWETVQAGDEPELSTTLAAYQTWQKITTATGEGVAEVPPEVAARYLRAIEGERDLGPARAAMVKAMGGAKKAVCQTLPIAQKQRTAGGGIGVVVSRKRPHSTDIRIMEGAA